MHPPTKSSDEVLPSLKKRKDFFIRRFCFLFFLSAQSVIVSAQVSLPDSIQSFMDRQVKDSVFVIALNQLAFSYLKSNPSITRELAARSVERARDLNFVRGYARALDLTGSSYWVVGDYESALDYYQLSARESGAIHDTTSLARAYNNMGEVYKKIGDYPKSIELLTLSMNWRKKLKAPYAITVYNIGEDYLLMNRLKDAIEYFNQAISQALIENDSRTLAYVYQGLGIIRLKEGEKFQSLAYLTKAEKLWKSQQELRSLIQTYQTFTEAFIALNDFEKAKKYIDEAKQLATRIQAADLQMENYKTEAKLYIAQSDYKQTVNVLTKYNSLKDSLYNLKKTEQIARLQALFDTESRDIENQQLKTEQTEKTEQIRFQQLLILAISLGLIVSLIMAWALFRQRRQIMNVNELLKDRNNEVQQQKEEIDSQTKKLISLNEQLQNMNRSLEDRIEERTHLLRSQNEKLASYAHANAHHLRAPIVSILGLLNLIEKIQLSPEDQVLIKHLQKCGQDLDRITRAISRDLEKEEGTV